MNAEVSGSARTRKRWRRGSHIEGRQLQRDLQGPPHDDDALSASQLLVDRLYGRENRLALAGRDHAELEAFLPGRVVVSHVLERLGGAVPPEVCRGESFRHEGFGDPPTMLAQVGAVDGAFDDCLDPAAQACENRMWISTASSFVTKHRDARSSIEA